MSKFCSNCGTEVVDEANNCPNCGNSFAQPTYLPVNIKQAISSFDVKKYLPIGAVAVAVVLVVVIATSIFGGGYKKPLKYMEQTLNGNFKNFEKTKPAAYWEYYADEYDEDIEDLLEEAEDSYDERLDYLEDEYGNDIKFSIKNIEKKKVLSERKLDNIRDGLKDNYDIPKKSVTKAIELEYEIFIKGDEDDDDDDAEVIVAKIDGKWYAVTENGYFS